MVRYTRSSTLDLIALQKPYGAASHAAIVIEPVETEHCNLTRIASVKSTQIQLKYINKLLIRLL